MNKICLTTKKTKRNNNYLPCMCTCIDKCKVEKTICTRKANKYVNKKKSYNNNNKCIQI